MQLKHIIAPFLSLLFLYNLADSQDLTVKNNWDRFKVSDKESIAGSRNSSLYQLIQFEKSTTRYDLAQKGIEIVRVLDTEHVIIKGSIPVPFSTLSQWPVNNLWKLGAQLVNVAPYQSYRVIIRSTDLSATKSFLNSSGFPYRDIASGVLTLSCHTEFIQRLIERPEIIYVGQESGQAKEESRVLDLNLNVNAINRVHNQFPGLDGRPITLSIQEQRFKSSDIDIRGRIRESALSSSFESNHATDMATIAAGAGNSFVTGKGAAPAATLTSSDFTDVLPDQDADYKELGVTVQNHSYGTEIESFYGVAAEAFDRNAHNVPTLLHVISSGNSGLLQDTLGTYKNIPFFANLTGNFKMAKNVLIVGSVDTVGRPIPFVSKGPAYDGRIKPELVSYSTAGSSNSAALTSGVVALIQHAFLDKKGSLPESAWLRAILINSATDVGQKAVDFETGFGNLNAYDALQTLLNDRYISDVIDHGETFSKVLSVPANAQNLKITLVWNDPPALPNSNLALVNDLDLTLSSTGQQWLPWVLDVTPDAELLSQPAQRGIDHLNTVEQITIDAPAAGDYTLTVTGSTIVDGPQSFHMAYQWDTLEQFTWSFPTSTDNMPYDGETTGYFRWQSTLTQGFGQLEYSTDQGLTWQLIDREVDLTAGHYRWQPPVLNTSAQVRMKIGDTVYYSDTFTISRPLSLRVAFNCTDSLLLQWNLVNPISHYDLYSMGDQYLEKITSLSDTSLVLYKSDFISPFFAIQPHLANDDIPLIKSYTIDYNLIGTSCYLISFYSEKTDSDEIMINLNLGSIYGVNKVIFEKQRDQVFEPFATLNPTSTTISLEDPAPLQGVNRYRARILFSNGYEMITEESLIYFLTEKPFLVFPNPVRPGNSINVFSKSFDPTITRTFRLISKTGQTVRLENLSTTREFIDTQGLIPGLYFYRISANGIESTGKIILID